MHIGRKNNNETSAKQDASGENQGAQPSVLTVKEAAIVLRVSRWMIYQLIRTRQLASFKLGSRRCVPTAAVHDLVTARLAEEAA